MRLPLLLAALLLVGCDSSNKDKPIDIGHIYPPGGGTAGDEERTIQLAVDELNKDPSRLPLGRQLKRRQAPGGAKPEEWGAQAARLIALNQVHALIGGDRGLFAERIGMAVQGEEVIAVSTAGWPGPTPAQNLFTVGLPPAERGRALAGRAKAANPKAILVVRDPNARAAGLAADRFVADCQAAMPAVVVRRGDVSDLGDATKMGFDVVFCACPARAAVKVRAAFPMNPLFLFGDEDAELPALLAEGGAAEGFVFAAAANPNDKAERLAGFAGRYQAAFQQPPTVAAVLAHDALSVWVEAARRAGSLEAAAIRGELLKRDTPFEVLTGTLTFADDHTAQRPAFVGQVRGGKPGEVGP